jgi:hypothetical protein
MYENITTFTTTDEPARIREIYILLKCTNSRDAEMEYTVAPRAPGQTTPVARKTSPASVRARLRVFVAASIPESRIDDRLELDAPRTEDDTMSRTTVSSRCRCSFVSAFRTFTFAVCLAAL